MREYWRAMQRFARRLARDMGLPLPMLAAAMPTQEFFAHWRDWCESPWGEERADLRSGILASVMANVHRSKDVAPFRARDFMPYAPAGDAPEPDVAEMFAS